MGGKRKIIRAATVPTSLETFLDGAFEALMERYDLVLLSSPGAELDRLGERHGVRTVAVAMERHMAPLKDLVALLRLIVVFVRERPRMVHSMTPKAGLLCMLAAWIAHVPLRVHTFTGLVAYGYWAYATHSDVDGLANVCLCHSCGAGGAWCDARLAAAHHSQADACAWLWQCEGCGYEALEP